MLSLPGLPALHFFEDETFYSLCCRQHIFLSSLNIASTLDWVYGTNAPAIKHDFPGNLDSLNQSAQDTWGSPESIIFQHTILPLFSPFQSDKRIHEAVLAMKSPHIGPLKYRLGLSTGRFGAEHPLKACFSCMQKDRALHGVAFWHLMHQYPGVILCPTHGLRLAQAAVNRQFMGRFRLALPNEEILYQDAEELSPATLKALSEFGGAVLDLAALGRIRSFKPQIVRLAYREALRRLGSSVADRKTAAASFAAHCCRLQPFPPLGSLPTTQQAAESFISRMTYKPRGCWHPLKHLALITWIFSRLESFVKAYDGLDDFASKNVCRLKIETTVETRVPLHSATPGPTIRKPKKLKSKIRSEILESLRRGDSKDEVCSSFGISICTLNRLLREEPLVLESRRELLNKSKLAENRAEWLRLTKEHPGSSPKKIRLLSPRTYAWLYRNDREWLSLKSRSMPRGLLGNNSSVNWALRDTELFSLLLEVSSKLVSPPMTPKIRRIDLIKLVPGLIRAFDYPNHYPNTNQLVIRLTGRNGMTTS